LGQERMSEGGVIVGVFQGLLENVLAALEIV
jgi:hypothetical protein